MPGAHTLPADPASSGATRRWLRRLVLLVVALVPIAVALALAPPLGVGTRIDNVVVITKPPAVVFDYVTTPANWPKWHPSSVAVRGDTAHSLAVGEQVTEDFVVAGRRGTAVWTVRDREVPYRWSIETTIADARGAGTVTYFVTPDVNGSRFERVLTYRFGSLLGELADRFVLRDRIAAESSEAVLRLQHILDSLR